MPARECCPAVGVAPAPGRPSPVRDAGDEARDEEDEAVLALARRAAAEHQGQHGQPITRDALRARLGVSNQAASELLRQLRADQGQPQGTSRPPDPGSPPRAGQRPGPRRQAGCPRGNTARRAAWRGSTGTAKAWQPTGDRSRPRVGRLAAAPARPAGAEGLWPGSPGAGDGQRKRKTVYRDLRTCRPSMSSASLPANTGTCRQRSALAAANVQDSAGINLPVNSQTVLGASS